MSIKTFQNTDMTQISPHFNVKEFKCQCGQPHEIILSEDLINKLEELFSALDCYKIEIISGYRCKKQDELVGGNGSSSHTKGIAADIVCYDEKMKKISSEIVSNAAKNLDLNIISSISNSSTHIEIMNEDEIFCTKNGVFSNVSSSPPIVARGIDVSYHNGEIDWQKVKLDGIEFAIIRISYGGNYENQDDKQGLRYISECERLGIPYGVYHYSYSLSVANVENEVAHTLRVLDGKNPTLGVWFDMEDGDHYKVRKNVPLTIENGELYSEICRSFCKGISDAGISYCGVYASQYILENVLSISDLNIWVAQWNNCCTYNGKYDFWQYTSKGVVDGISGNVDLDYCFKQFDIFNNNTQDIQKNVKKNDDFGKKDPDTLNKDLND